MIMKMLGRPREGLVAILLLALPVAISSCQIPDRPVWWPSTQAAISSPSAASAASSVVLKVAKPWRPGMRQLGIAVYWVANLLDSATVVRAKARRIINYAVSLHSNSISVSFPFYTYGVTSDTVYRKKTTPSTQDIAIFLAEARKSQIRTMLRPILNEDVLYKAHAWRGSIQPAHPAAWFTSYRNLLLPYARVSAAGHLRTFVVGTELNSMEASSHWPALIQAIRNVYAGQLAYDENTGDFQQHDNHLPLATFGVDAWPRIQLPDSATVTQLTGAWSTWLGTHTLAVRRKAILTEVGIRAMAGAYPDPAKWNGIGQPTIVTRIQTNWFRALCAAVQREHMGGIYWWEVSFDANPAKPQVFWSDPFTYLGRPAQGVVNTCFTKLTSVSTF